MFPENILSEFVLVDLDDELSGYTPPAPDPLPCDRWVARSCLQKAIRRGEGGLALQALANLLSHDRRSVWRHLTIIALEDVGVADIDLVARVICAARNGPWRRARGGDWPIAAYLAARMAGAPHCQAACDLLLRATNCPSLDQARAQALDTDRLELIEELWDGQTSLQKAGINALAISGGLDDGQRYREPSTVFEALSEQGYSSHVVAACHAGWKVSRNPMAFMLPLVWRRWMGEGPGEERDDDMPQVTWIGAVPGYAIDQFTRVGGQVARAYLKADSDMDAMFDAAQVGKAMRPRALGDVIFLTEGGCIMRRAIWSMGEQLRQPFRALPNAVLLGDKLQQCKARLDANRSVIENLRQCYLNTSYSA